VCVCVCVCVCVVIISKSRGKPIEVLGNEQRKRNIQEKEEIAHHDLN